MSNLFAARWPLFNLRSQTLLKWLGLIPNNLMPANYISTLIAARMIHHLISLHHEARITEKNRRIWSVGGKVHPALRHPKLANLKRRGKGSTRRVWALDTFSHTHKQTYFKREQNTIQFFWLLEKIDLGTGFDITLPLVTASFFEHRGTQNWHINWKFFFQ